MFQILLALNIHLTFGIVAYLVVFLLDSLIDLFEPERDFWGYFQDGLYVLRVIVKIQIVLFIISAFIGELVFHENFVHLYCETFSLD